MQRLHLVELIVTRLREAGRKPYELTRLTGALPGVIATPLSIERATVLVSSSMRQGDLLARAASAFFQHDPRAVTGLSPRFALGVLSRIDRRMPVSAWDWQAPFHPSRTDRSTIAAAAGLIVVVGSLVWLLSNDALTEQRTPAPPVIAAPDRSRVVTPQQIAAHQRHPNAIRTHKRKHTTVIATAPRPLVAAPAAKIPLHRYHHRAYVPRPSIPYYAVQYRTPRLHRHAGTIQPVPVVRVPQPTAPPAIPMTPPAAGMFVETDGSDAARSGIVMVRHYLNALMGGDEEAAYTDLGVSPDSGRRLDEEQFIDTSTHIVSMRSSVLANGNAVVEVELESGKGLYYETYHVAQNSRGAVIADHDFIKP